MQNEGFVLVKDSKGEMVKIEDRKELEAFLAGFAGEALSNCVWDSIKEAFRVGRNVGRKQAQNPDGGYQHRDSGNKPHFGGER